MNRDWTTPPSSSVRATARNGGGMLLRISYFVHHLADCGAMLHGNSSQGDTSKISVSCLSATSVLLGNDTPVGCLQILNA